MHWNFAKNMRFHITNICCIVLAYHVKSQHRFLTEKFKKEVRYENLCKTLRKLLSTTCLLVFTSECVLNVDSMCGQIRL